MEIHKHKPIILLSAGVFALVVAALLTMFYTSKVSQIKKEQQKLIQANIFLSKTIKAKKHQYEQIQDKIENITSLINDKATNKNSHVKKLLANMDSKTKKMLLDSLPTGYPCKSHRVTSSFGYRFHPIHKEERFHHGLDFGGAEGTPIKATADGLVEFSGFNKGGYGNLVVISHNFGFKTAYGHMLKNLKVKKGDFVKKGEVLGYLGNTGLSTGPHLHYEIKYLKSPLNPKSFISWNLVNFDKTLYSENHIAWGSLLQSVINNIYKVTEEF